MTGIEVILNLIIVEVARPARVVHGELRGARSLVSES